MSSIEERLTREIAAVTKGVVVTERDLLEAWSAVDERVDSKRLSGHRRTVALVAAAAVVIAGVGIGAFQPWGGKEESVTPAGSGPTGVDPYADWFVGELPTPELVDGFWRVDNGQLSMLFSEDGTVRFDDRGAVVSDPATTGTYEINGDAIIVTTTDGGACQGSELAVRATLPNPGHMRVLVTSATPSDCAAFPPGRRLLEHVLPTSKEIAGYFPTGDSGWEPLEGNVSLAGDWFAERGGQDVPSTVLEIAPDGTYYILREELLEDFVHTVDQGRWLLRGDSDLVLTSSALSAECREGDQLVLGAMEQIYVGTTSIRGTLKQNTCDAPWTPQAWIRVPNAGS